MRFLRRTREQLKRAVDKAVRERNISDAAKGGSVSIPSDGIREPQFHLSNTGGDYERVLPGNKEFVSGDRIEKPRSGRGGGGRERLRFGRRRGRVLLRADGRRISRHPVRRSRTARTRQGLAEGRHSQRIPAGRLFQRRHDAQPQRAAHHALQHEPTSGVAAAVDGRSPASRGGTERAAGQGYARSGRTEAHPEAVRRHRAAQTPAADDSLHRSDRRSLQQVHAGGHSRARRPSCSA